jgi:hypothetical protein
MPIRFHRCRRDVAAECATDAQARGQVRDFAGPLAAARAAGTGIAPISVVDGTLKARLLEHARDERADSAFVDRLLTLMDRIEREFSGEHREQLLALAQDTFDRHLRQRCETRRARAGLAAWSEDQRRLLALLDFLSRDARGARIH